LEFLMDKRTAELLVYLKEAVNVLREENGMPPMDAASTAPPAPDMGAAPPPPSVPGQNPQEQAPPYTVDNLISQLNVIRGGKSFSEPEIYKALSGLFNALPEESKQVLNKSLADIGGAVTTGQEGQLSQQPSDPSMPQAGAPPVAPPAPTAAPAGPPL
jgi:hypothetical protein